jgi:hypothetical protein
MTPIRMRFRYTPMTLLKKGQFEIFLLKKWEEIIENDHEIASVVHENAENHLQSGRKFAAFRESRVFSVESPMLSAYSRINSIDQYSD